MPTNFYWHPIFFTFRHHCRANGVSVSWVKFLHTLRYTLYLHFLVEVKQWEHQLGRVQTILSLWQRVQEHWLYLGGFQLLDLIIPELKSHMTC